MLGEGPAKISPFKAQMAMTVRSKNAPWKMRDILRRHSAALGARHGVLSGDGHEVQVLIDHFVSRTPQIIASISAQLPDGFPAPVASAIFESLRDAAKILAD